MVFSRQLFEVDPKASYRAAEDLMLIEASFTVIAREQNIVNSNKSASVASIKLKLLATTINVLYCSNYPLNC